MKLIQMLLRIIKIVLFTCLFPVWFITSCLTMFVLTPTLWIIDIFVYIYKGRWWVLSKKFLFNYRDDDWFGFEMLITGWWAKLSKLYDKKIVKRFK